jgi:hypothetical protein
VWIGPLNLSPFVEAQGFLDSNVDFIREGERPVKGQALAEETFGYGIQPGLYLSMPGNGWSLSGRGWYRFENYEDPLAESRRDWAETMEFFAESASGRGLRISELFQQVNHEDFQTGRWDDRFEGRVRGDVGGRITDKTRLFVGGVYDEIKYDDPDLYDWRRYGGQANLARRITEKSDGVLMVEVNRQTSEKQNGDADGVLANLGVASRATEKTHYRMTAGAEYYSGFEGDDSRVGVAYELGLTWKATDRLTATMSGSSLYQPAEDVEDNSMLVSTIGAGLEYSPLRRWTALLDALYRREDYTLPVRGTDPLRPGSSIDTSLPGQSRKDDQITGHARLTFAVTHDVSVFADGIYTFSTSSIEEYDYERWRAGLGLAARY